MDKTMVLAILVAYKTFNDKSLTIRTNEYVVDGANIDSIDENEHEVSDIDYEDILDNLDDYEYPYNHVNRNNL